jgi:hypothetical protein
MNNIVEIREVKSKNEWRSFKNLPWVINKDDKKWVPPLRVSIDELFNLKTHPFWSTVSHGFFIAVKNKEVVGRIAVSFPKQNNKAIGHWGFLEAKDDAAIFNSLLEKAEAILGEKGCKKIIGPLNPGINYELGVLTDGFDYPPYFMLSHNPRYYDGYIKMAGHQKEKDFYSYIIAKEEYNSTSKINRVIDGLTRRRKISIRTVDTKNFDEELKLLFDIYNDAFEKHWGFSAMPADEFRYMAKDFNKIIDPDLIFFIYYDSEPAGFLLSLPNINEILIKIRNGKLFPFGFLKYLYLKNKIRTFRIITIAIKQKFQHLGLGSFLYQAVAKRSVEKGYYQAELSWVIENNITMNKAAMEMGGKIYKTYRLYSKEI